MASTVVWGTTPDDWFETCTGDPSVNESQLEWLREHFEVYSYRVITKGAYHYFCAEVDRSAATLLRLYDIPNFTIDEITDEWPTMSWWWTPPVK